MQVHTKLSAEHVPWVSASPALVAVQVSIAPVHARVVAGFASCGHSAASTCTPLREHVAVRVVDAGQPVVGQRAQSDTAHTGQTGPAHAKVVAGACPKQVPSEQDTVCVAVPCSPHLASHV